MARRSTLSSESESESGFESDLIQNLNQNLTWFWIRITIIINIRNLTLPPLTSGFGTPGFGKGTRAPPFSFSFSFFSFTPTIIWWEERHELRLASGWKRERSVERGRNGWIVEGEVHNGTPRPHFQTMQSEGSQKSSRGMPTKRDSAVALKVRLEGEAQWGVWDVCVSFWYGWIEGDMVQFGRYGFVRCRVSSDRAWVRCNSSCFYISAAIQQWRGCQKWIEIARRVLKAFVQLMKNILQMCGVRISRHLWNMLSHHTI